MHTQPCFFLKIAFLLNYYYYLILKNKHIQTKINQFSENTFKINVMLGRTLLGFNYILGRDLVLLAILTFTEPIIYFYLIDTNFFVYSFPLSKAYIKIISQN